MSAVLKRAPAPAVSTLVGKEPTAAFDAFRDFTKHLLPRGLVIKNVSTGSNRLLLGRRYPLKLKAPSQPHSLESSEVRSTGEQGSWDGLRGYLDEWTMFAADWDGESGVVPSAGVLTGVREMITALETRHVKVPQIYIAGDGEIGLRWQNEANYASASFVDEGDLLLYMHEGDKVLHDRDVPWANDLDIENFIKDVARLA